MAKITIIGAGWVGKSMSQLFPDAYVYHPNRDFETKVKEDRIEANQADIAFVCVPTPLGKDGRLDTSIVEECVAWLKVDLIVIRSTVNPGDCHRWIHHYKKKILFQPEYLGETPNHPLLDEKQTPFIIIGDYEEDKTNSTKLIQLYQTVYNANVRIRQVTHLEAEVIKLTENRAIAFKVMQCQELYDACKSTGVDYYTIRDAVYGDDPRFNLWWTFVYPDKRGFNSSKCLSKDVPAWCAWAKCVGWADPKGIEPKLTEALIEKSNEYALLDYYEGK